MKDEEETGVYGVVLKKSIARKARIVAAALGKSRSKLMAELLINYLNKWEDLEIPEGLNDTTSPPK